MFGRSALSARLAGAAFLLTVALPAAAADLAPGPQGPLAPQARVGGLRQQEHRVPFAAGGGGPLMQALLTLPDGQGPWPGIVITHGAPRPEDRKRRLYYAGTTAWFAKRGFAVLNLTRRGYGQSMGQWVEGYGNCNFPYFKEAGEATADDLMAAVRYIRALPNVIEDRIVVAGTSAGGWGTLALAARNPEGVRLGLNFAGGRGKSVRGTCGFESFYVEALTAWGKTARVPTLWLYAANDGYWGPELPKRMFAAWRAAGAPAELWAAPDYPHHDDGHYIFGHAKGWQFWGKRVAEALKKTPGVGGP